MGRTKSVIAALFGLMLAAPAGAQEAEWRELQLRCRVISDETAALLRTGQVKQARTHRGEMDLCALVFKAALMISTRKLIDGMTEPAGSLTSPAPR